MNPFLYWTSLSPVPLEMVRGHLYGDVRGQRGLGKGRMNGHRTNTWEDPRRYEELSPLLVPAKMTGVATPRLLPGPEAPGREVLPWLRKRRPFRKTSSCRVQSGGTGGARAAGRDENRLGGNWMEARATLFWGDTGVSQKHPDPLGL